MTKTQTQNLENVDSIILAMPKRIGFKVTESITGNKWFIADKTNDRIATLTKNGYQYDWQFTKPELSNLQMELQRKFSFMGSAIIGFSTLEVYASLHAYPKVC